MLVNDEKREGENENMKEMKFRDRIVGTKSRGTYTNL